MRCEGIETWNLGPFPEKLIDSLLTDLDAQTAEAEPCGLTVSEEYSNDLAEIRFSDGRTLMVKRARARWAAPRFDASRRAAKLLRERCGIVAPEHFPVPIGPDRLACHAYWRIPLPTLKDVWPQIPPRLRPDVLRSWGELIGRIHEPTLPGFGPFERIARTPSPLAAFLEDDLVRRLGPAVTDVWPEGLEALQQLIEAIPAVAARAGDTAVVVHNDMHMENVLCEVGSAAVRCVGVLDLEAAFAGPPEADLAMAEVLHGRLFAQPLEPEWLEPVLEGYGRPLEPRILAFFRAYHLLNLGFHAALVGHEEHARDVARAALQEVHALKLARRAAGRPTMSTHRDFVVTHESAGSPSGV